MHSFRDISANEIELALNTGEYLSQRDADFRAAQRILDGFDTLEEAGQWARDFDYKHDAYGYCISSDAIEWAIWFILEPITIKGKIGHAFEHDGITWAIQSWGQPGKRGPKKCSRKQAIKSGTPYLYLWSWKEDTFTWVNVFDLSMSLPGIIST